MQLRLPPMHPGQKAFVSDPARIVVAACGTKTGKTFGMGCWIIKQAFDKPQSMNWWAAPTYRQAKIAFALIGRILPPGCFRKRSSQGEMAYELLKADGSVYSTIEFRSADNPESLRGEGVHACVIDEACYWGHDSFVSVWTTLTRTRGKLRIISTPKGRNWFYDEWMKGWDPEQNLKFPEYSAHQLPTHSNPFVPRESLIEAKRNLPEDVYRQEYLAEFLDESAGVFHGIRAAMVGPWLAGPIPGRSYVMGIDWAKREDWTVFAIADRATHEVVHLVRHQLVDWDANIKKAIDVAKRWNRAQIIMDSTGVGDVPYDQIRSIYPTVHGYQISTSAAKQALIQKMQFALEQSTIKLPAKTNASQLPQTLQKELEMYGFVVSPTGKLQYSAPDGYHDDCVIALCLANWALSEAGISYRAVSRRGV